MADPLGSRNPRIKRLRRLTGRRSSRLDEGAFVIEGPTLVRDAVAAGVELEEVFVDAEAVPPVEDLDVTLVAPGVLASVLPTASPRPVCATAPMRLHRPVADVVVAATDEARPLLVLVDVGDPGNVGTLLRAAEASGCGGAVLAGSTADLYSPKVVRSAAGSVFRLPIAVAGAPADLLVELAELGVTTFAAVARGGDGHLEAPLGDTVAIVLGNEAHGLDDAIVAACDRIVTIVMDGPSESLNVAMAGTVLLFEALRQRLSDA